MSIQRLSETVCICTGGHDPERRVECRYAVRAAERFLASPWLAAYVAAAVETARRDGAETALREAADEADSVGHHWSGAPALAFFALAGDLRARADALLAATEGER